MLQPLPLGIDQQCDSDWLRRLVCSSFPREGTQEMEEATKEKKPKKEKKKKDKKVDG